MSPLFASHSIDEADRVRCNFLCGIELSVPRNKSLNVSTESFSSADCGFKSDISSPDVRGRYAGCPRAPNFQNPVEHDLHLRSRLVPT